MVVELRNECLARGPITHAVCTFYKRYLGPHVSPLDRMMNDGVHVIDTLRWLSGGELAEILSVSRRVGVPDINFCTA